MTKYFTLVAIIVVGFSTTLPSCKEKDERFIPTSKKESPIVWRKSLKRTELTSTIFWYDGSIVFAHPDSTENVLAVYRLDPETGDEIWVTRLPSGFTPNFPEQSALVDGKLVLAEGATLYVLDVNTGSVLWNNELLDDLSGYFTVHDGYIYTSTYDWDNKNWSSLCRFELETGKYEFLFKVIRGETNSFYSPDLMMPVLWYHPSGDEILVLQNRSYGWYVNMKPKMDILAFNMTADTMLWYRERLDGFSSMSGPAISGDNVYFYGDHHAYCINPLDGSTRWKFFIGNGPEDDFNTANVLLVDDKLIVKPDNSEIHAVDKETGEHLWSNRESVPMPGLLTEHRDTIWLGSGGIVAVDANTGENIIDWDNYNKGSWIFPILHHPTKGRVFTSDASYMYCLDVNLLHY